MRTSSKAPVRHSLLRSGSIGLAGLLLLLLGMPHSGSAAYPDAIPGSAESQTPGIAPLQTPSTQSPGDANPTPRIRDSGTGADLNTLFDRLKQAKSEAEAQRVHAMIAVEFLRSGSDTIDLLMFRAISAIENQDMSLALDLLDTVIALKPDYAEGWNKRATLYFMKRDYGKALSDVEMVLRLQPRHYAAMSGLAQMLHELGDDKHALEALKQVLAIYPMNSEVAKQLEELQGTIDGKKL